MEDASRPAVPPRTQLVGTCKEPVPNGCTCEAAQGPLHPGTFSGWLPGGHRSRSWAAPACVCPEEPAPDPAGDGLHTGSPSLPPWLSDVQSS